MKTTSIVRLRFLCICLMYCVLFPSVSQAYDDGVLLNSWFITLCNNAFRVLYLEDGRILFATMSAQPGIYKVDGISCIDDKNKVLWQCDMLESTLSPFMDIKKMQDGSFAFLGCKEDGTFQIVFIDEGGGIINRLLLPSTSYTPVLVETGVLFVAASEKEGATIVKMDWNGITKCLTIDRFKSISIFHGVSTDKNTYLSIFYRNLDEQTIASIVCLDETDEMLWRYDIGQDSIYSARVWASNNMGGITMAVECLDDKGEAVTSSLDIICLDTYGTIVWKKKVMSYDPVPHVMDQTEDGNYRIWGFTSKERDQYKSFLLVLDIAGNFVYNEFKSEWGDSHKYLDGEVYATIYRDNLAQAHVEFSIMENIQLDSFVVK